MKHTFQIETIPNISKTSHKGVEWIFKALNPHIQSQTVLIICLKNPFFETEFIFHFSLKKSKLCSIPPPLIFDPPLYFGNSPSPLYDQFLYAIPPEERGLRLCNHEKHKPYAFGNVTMIEPISSQTDRSQL